MVKFLVQLNEGPSRQAAIAAPSLAI